MDDIEIIESVFNHLIFIILLLFLLFKKPQLFTADYVHKLSPEALTAIVEHLNDDTMIDTKFNEIDLNKHDIQVNKFKIVSSETAKF